MLTQSESFGRQVRPSRQPAGAQRIRAVIAPLLKFLPVILKSGGSMLLMVGVYSGLWGWKYAVGFVVLLLLHEMGHLIATLALGMHVAELDLRHRVHAGSAQAGGHEAK